MSSPSLSIVIPSHQRHDLLRACLRSITRHAPSATEILVVDDASPNAVATKTARGFSGVRWLRLGKRSGFAAAANAGILATSGDIVEVLNDDTEVQAGWTDAALSHFRDERIAAVAPLVLDCSSRIDSAGDRYYLGGVARKRGHGERPGERYEEAMPVFGASASSAFYRRSALQKVGLFPQCFGSYFEDVDLAFRLQRAGYRAVYEPASRVLHHGGASHGAVLHGRPNRALLAQQSLNEERVFWRNIPARQMTRALPRHAAVLLGKAHRRWHEGSFWPFLWGKLRILLEVPALWRHRKELLRVGSGQDFDSWCVEPRWQDTPSQ